MSRSVSTSSTMDTEIIFGYRKPKSISGLLIRSDVKIADLIPHVLPNAIDGILTILHGLINLGKLEEPTQEGCIKS